MGESVYGTGKLQEVVENLTKVVETANRLVTEESDDLVDSVNSSRHFKVINEALKQFNKSANEVMIHERRMAAAFEDIAEGIKKYYEVH
jgi:pyridoxal biosynthesis lyase PdxS